MKTYLRVINFQSKYCKENYHNKCSAIWNGFGFTFSCGCLCHEDRLDGKSDQLINPSYVHSATHSKSSAYSNQRERVEKIGD
jgi:hypothetical protein